jgi:cobalamin biosynthesis protein CobT
MGELKMKKFVLILGTLMLSMALVACGTEQEVSQVNNNGEEAEDVSSNEDGNEEKAAQEDENEEEAAQEDGNEEEGTQEEENEEAAQEDENEEAPEGDEFGTRNNPVKHGETVEVKGNDFFYGDFHYELTLVESVAGEVAWDMVKEGNQFNEEAGEGKEYILAKFDLQLHFVEEEPFDVYGQRFDVISESGSSYEDFVSVSGLEPEFNSDLYEGGSVEGWVAFVVNEDDEKPLAVFDRSTDGGVWFDLRGE